MDLSDTFGIMYWGFVISTTLFGISVVQGYFFFVRNKERDARKLKLFVALLLLLDLTTTALSSEALHHYLVVNFGNPNALLYMTRTYVAEYVVTAIVVFLCQNFYAWRIYAVNKRIWVAGLIFSFALLSLGGSIAFTKELLTVNFELADLSKSKMMIYLSLGTSFAAASDILATAAMCIYLTAYKSAYKETNTLLKKMLFFTVNRGFLVAFAQIGQLVLYLAFPKRSDWMPFHLTLSKLHVNSLLAMLNSRATIREKVNATKLEIRTSFGASALPGAIGVGCGSPNSASSVSPSPRTPSFKRQNSVSGLGGFDVFDAVRDPRIRMQKRPSVMFAEMRRPPGIEEERDGDTEVGDYNAEENQANSGEPNRKVRTVIYTGDDDPITFF